MKINAASNSIAKKKTSKIPKTLEGLKTVGKSKSKKKEPVILTVNRGKWIRGLLADSGKRMCIMGQYLHKVGKIPIVELENRGYPSSFKSQLRGTSLSWVIGRGSDSVNAININDTAPVDRESKLKEIFAKHGVTLRFVG